MTGRASEERRDLLARYGGLMGRDTAIYVIGFLVVFPFSFVQAAVLTRFMDPSEYGDLGILLIFSSLLTIVLNLGTLHGTFMYTFKAAGDGDMEDGIDGGEVIPEEDLREAAYARDKRRALTTGMALTVVVVIALVVPLIVFGPSVGQLLLREADAGDLVTWACLSAAAGALWRFGHNVLRMERRPVLWVIANTLRPLFVVGLSVALVASGQGITGALVGTTVGTLVTLVLCLAITSSSYGFSVSVNDARSILRLGGPYAGMTLSLWVVHSADVLLLSRFVPAAEVGLYRLASRLASIPSYFVSAFLMASAPLERSMLFTATYQRMGETAVRSVLFTYYVVSALSIVLVLALSADVLVLIAAPSYRDAAQLIGPIALSLVLYGCFVVLFRWVRISSRRFMRVGLTALAAVLFTAFAVVLIPLFGAYGAPAATSLAMAIVIAILLWLARGSDESITIQWPKVLGGVACAVGCWAVGAELGRLAPEGIHVVASVASLAAYPMLLVATGVIPRQHVRVLVQALRAALPNLRGGSRLLAGLGELPPRRRAVLEAVVRDRRPIADVALEERLSERQAGVRLVRSLRQLGAVGTAGDQDADLGRYLTMDGPPAARDALARHLVSEGLDPLELHELEEAMVALRRAPRRAWETRSVGASEAMQR